MHYVIPDKDFIEASEDLVKVIDQHILDNVTKLGSKDE